MTRFRLTIEYDGAAFSGWQRQSEGVSVQGVLEHAVAQFNGAPAEVVGAGRTDAGVHALGQVAHVDVTREADSFKISEAINALVRPHPVAVIDARETTPAFHARFDAVRRVYCYRIANRRAPLTLDRGKAWLVPRLLTSSPMREAAKRLIGQHDFTTFRDAQCQAKSPVKTLDVCDVKEAGEEIHVWCEARSFLHRQVRSIVGTLVEVGIGRMTPDDVAAALAAKDRARCGQVAPPDGLLLVRVDY